MFLRSITKVTILSFFGLAFGIQIGCSKGTLVGPESADYLATAAQDDCGYIQNEFGHRVSWKSHIPVEFFVSKSIPTEFHQDIVNAADDWNQSAGRPIIKINLTELETSESSQDVKNTIVGVTDWEASKSTQQAVTAVKYRGALITRANVRVNLKDFTYYSKESADPKQIHFGSLLVHELGHGLGLKHGLLRPTVMWYTLAALFIRTKLSTTDLKSLECEYR